METWLPGHPGAHPADRALGMGSPIQGGPQNLRYWEQTRTVLSGCHTVGKGLPLLPPAGRKSILVLTQPPA